MHRSKHLFRKVIKYNNWKNNQLLIIFKKSWIKNYKINFINRFSIQWRWKFHTKHNRFYLSQNKLQCFLHYNFSVPNKKVHLSRFIIGKSSDSLMLGGYQKR